MLHPALTDMSVEQFILRLLIVVAVSFIIGLERQITGHNMSFKTTVLIGIGSFTFVSVEVFLGTGDARMAANVITGIGFLCSGVIFKNGASVNGLNTSATLWTTAGISVLIGYGHVWEGLLATAVLVVLNIIMAFVNAKIHPSEKMSEMNESYYNIQVVCIRTEVKKVKKVINENIPKGLNIEMFEVDVETASKCRITVRFKTDGNPVKDIANICDKIFEKDVISVTYDRLEE
ncbi:MAG: MgtC/SapB family protein [Lachnospiraceae bacterium]|nr:MgtC/SapB family protein [Lachnospiraceae bacterium]